MSAAEGDAGVIRVGTRFASLDDLVARAAVVLSGDSITVPASTLPPAGERRRFQVLLADGTVALEGLGEVTAGERLRIVELDAASRAVHERILAARKPLPRPSGSRPAPPPHRRTLEGPPPPKPAEPAPAPPAVAPPVVAPTPTPVDDEPLPALGWQVPPWLRSRRVQIALGVTGAILLVGLVAALARDDDAPRAPATIAGSGRIDAGRGSEPPPSDREPSPSEPELAEVEVADAEEAAPAAPAEKPRSRRERAPKRASPPPPTDKAAKKSGAGRMVRLSVKSDPPGASIRVDGESVEGGSVMVPGGSTVKVTATKRGYRRVTRSVDVGKGRSIVIKLEGM